MCNVTVLNAEVLERSNDIVESVRITGTIEDCQPTFSPNPNTPPLIQVLVEGVIIETGQPSTGTATLAVPDDLGATLFWQTILKGVNAPCDSNIRVTARCATDTSCQDIQEFPLPCDCPVVKLTKTVGECTELNARAVEFKVEIAELTTAEPIFGEIFTGIFNGATEVRIAVQFPGSDWQQDASGVWSRIFSQDYFPGTYQNVRLEVTFPERCPLQALAEDPTQPGRIDVPGCDDENCPNAADIQVLRLADDNDVTAIVEADQCIDPGRYRVIVISPSVEGTVYTWSVDNQVLEDPTDPNDPNFPVINGVDRNEYVHEVRAGQSDSISVSIQVPGCETPIPAGIDLQGCSEVSDCPEVTQFVVQDSRGNFVDPFNCLEPGSYTVTAEGPNLQDAQFQWTVNDAPAGTAQSQQVDVTQTGATSVRVRVSKPGCPDMESGIVLTPCPEQPPAEFDWCFLIRIFMLLGAGLAIVGLALLACPVFAGPLLDPVTAAIIGGALAGIGAIVFIVALLFWIFVCRPTPCDWLILAWQLAAFAALAFIYIAFCPACSGWGILGLVALGGFLLLFAWWLFGCRPTRCRVFQELLFFMVHADLVEVVQMGLGNCVLSSNQMFAWIWAGFLAVATAMAYWGTQNFCPNSGAGGN